MPKLDAFLLEVAETLNSSLQLEETLERVAQLVRQAIDYKIFAILLLDERTEELRFRFAIGYPQIVIDTFRIKLGVGVTGQAALRREPVLVNDVEDAPFYVEGPPGVRSELAVPLMIQGRLIGVINIEAPEPGYFTQEHVRLLTLVASRVAVAIENARLYTRVANQARLLTLLNEIARGLTSILNLDELLQRVGDELQRLTDYQMFSVLLLNPQNILVHRFSLRFGEKVQIKQDIPLGEGLVGFAALHNQPVVVADVLNDGRYIQTNQETRSELVVPLAYSGKVIGVLDIEHTQLGYFTEEHVRTIVTLAAQVAIAIENARLYQTVREQERRMEQDLTLARELQRQVLPACCPVLRCAEVFARFVPARQIGGDLYDFLPQSAERMGIAVGDVSGKGAPAAIYAALTSGFLRSHVGQRLSAAHMMSALNTSLTDRPVPGAYVSVLFAVWDEATGRMQIANSGLPQPILYRGSAAANDIPECQAMQRIEVGGLPAGMFPEATYEQITLSPEPGDLIVFSTDGILDASNVAGEMFGRTRMEKIIAENQDASAEGLVGAIFAAVAAHADGVEQFDDQTVVALKILGA